MLEVYLLGTGGMVPLPDRYLTSLLARCAGKGILIDCGEGTQMAIRSAGQGFAHIDIICLTHFHADHIAGLPGLLLTIGNSGRTEPVEIVGPPYVRQIVECLCVIAPQLPYPVIFREVQEAGDVLTIGDMTVSAQPVEHWVPCFAYSLTLSRKGRFDSERARALEIPVQGWKALQQGRSWSWEGKTVQPSQVMGPPRRGIKLCYATDLRPSAAVVEFARGADLFICEGMYGAPDMLQKAVKHRHCHFIEAAQMAAEAEAGELWLTHFSPSMPHPEDFLGGAAELFPSCRIDGGSVVLRYPD